mgnify:CR=1 FL=1
MQETGYETFSFYYDALTENVNYPARAAYLDGLVQKYKQSAGKSCWIWHAAPAP